MHPYTTELLVHFRQEDLQEAARSLHRPWPRPVRRLTRLRTAVGFWLVGLGLRLVVPAPAVAR